MAIKRISTVVGATDLAASVEFWSRALGAQPTFVDGDRWAQFDVGAARISIGAGTDRPPATSVMVSVDDLDQYIADMRAAGSDPGAIEVGAHERRITIAGPGGEALIVYQSL